MARTPAMRVRMDLARKIDPTNMEDLMQHAKDLQALKERAKELGFVFTGDVSAALGSIEVEGENNG